MPITGEEQPRKSIFYVLLITCVAALGGLLFGYDTAVIAGAIGFLQVHFQLDAVMKGWAAASALLGCIIGVSFAGIFSDRLGRKKTLVLSGILFLISAAGTAVAEQFGVFVSFRILGGVGIGVASMASPMYIAEVTPARVRGRMVSVNQLAIVTGMLIVYFVNYFIASQGDEMWNAANGWRWMFASGIAPSVLFLMLLFIVPESPRWLAERGRETLALKILTKVEGEKFAENEIRQIKENFTAESLSQKELFRPGLYKIIIIGIALAVLQQITGINVFLYYAPEIFKKLGSDINVALMQTVIVGAVNLSFTIVAIWTVDRLGRRPLMMIGSLGMGLALAAMGIAAQLNAVSLWMLLFVLTYIACFALSVGPVTWVILSEIFPMKLRGRALGIATFCLWTANFIVSQTFPLMDEDAWLVAKFNHAFPFYVYGIFCFVLFGVMWRIVPETKGRTLEEIERSWLSYSKLSPKVKQ